MKGRRIIVIVMIFMLAAGLVLLGFAAHYYIEGSSYMNRAELSTGTVTRNNPYQYTGQDSYQTYTYYCPMIRFQTNAGATVESEAQAACSDNDQPPKYKVGQKVELFYDPQNPKTFTLKDFNDVYYPLYATAVSGIIFLLIGLVLSLVLSRRSTKPQAPPYTGLDPFGPARGGSERDGELDQLAEIARLEQEEVDQSKQQKS